ncbi:hypothetical protein UY3_05180 [Chelonia mydas]|uniref:Uncharacterized protein n=1 Tax=Chelonia mydas TaxID=8469 RepID=M7BZT3_CHEMY|nr:hypothetical protein UY3_05180 [Chelonia mydas]
MADDRFATFFRAGAILLSAASAVGLQTIVIIHRFRYHSALLVVSKGRFRCNSARLLLSRHTTASVQPAQLLCPGSRRCRRSAKLVIQPLLPCTSALLQTPYHGKHGACSDHCGSYEHCKHLVHYHAVYAEPEPAKAEKKLLQISGCLLRRDYEATDNSRLLNGSNGLKHSQILEQQSYQSDRSTGGRFSQRREDPLNRPQIALPSTLVLHQNEKHYKQPRLYKISFPVKLLPGSFSILGVEPNQLYFITLQSSLAVVLNLRPRYYSCNAGVLLDTTGCVRLSNSSNSQACFSHLNLHLANSNHSSLLVTSSQLSIYGHLQNRFLHRATLEGHSNFG